MKDKLTKLTYHFLIILSLWGCDNTFINDEKINQKRRIITLSDDFQLEKYVGTLNKDVNYRTKAQEDIFSHADWNRVLREDFENKKVIYSVPLPSIFDHNGLILRNLVVVKIDDNFTDYVIKMYKDKQKVSDIEVTNLNNEILFTSKQEENFNGRIQAIECFEFMIDYPTTITVGEGSDAYSGTTWYSQSYTVCTTSGGGDSGPISAGDRGIGGCKCESSKDVSIIDNEQILKDMRLQEIKDSVYLKIENPCLQAMVTKAVYENLDNQISRIINLVFGNSELYDLSFHEDSNLSDTTLGEALVTHQTNGRILADIYLNVNVLKNSSQEMVISTIFHEVLHSYLKYSTPPEAQKYFNDHEEMANEYLSLMTSALQNLFPTLTTKNAQALSWGGLSETTAWKKLLNSNPAKANEIIQINQNHVNGTSGTDCQ